MSRALRVRLRFGTAAGRAETRPVICVAQTVAASLSATSPMLGLVTKGKKKNRIRTSFIVFV